MAVTCPGCGDQYDVTLFEFDNVVMCDCGRIVSRAWSASPERERMEVLKRAADRACSLILNSEYPKIDVEIEKEKVRDLCGELFPGRERLFDMVYGSRFQRLEEQFGGDV